MMRLSSDNISALARYYLGEVAAAREMLASNRQSGQPDVRSQASLASIEAAAGDKAAARQRAQSIERGSYMDHHVAYSLGAAWAQLGERTCRDEVAAAGGGDRLPL